MDDTESKSESKNESEVSRFALDGIVAEMVIEVDEEEAISPSKTLKLNGLERYNALKASALRKSSVMLGSKMNIDEKNIFSKEKEIESEKSLPIREDQQESDCTGEYNALKASALRKSTVMLGSKMNIDEKNIFSKEKEIESEKSLDIREDQQESESKVESTFFEQDKSKLDFHAVKDATETVVDLDFVEGETKDKEDKEPVILENQSEIISGTSKEQKCDSPEENLTFAPEDNNEENQDSDALEKQKSEVSEETKVSDREESLVSETQLEDESVVEEESSKKSSVRNKSKEVKERGNRSSSNQLKSSERMSQAETASTLPENKRSSLRSKLNTTADKSVSAKAKGVAQNKKSGKVETATLRKGLKRKLQDSGSKKGEPVKKQKQTEITSKTKRQKSGKSTPSISEAAVSRRHSLRKTQDTPSIKPKAYNLYPKSDSRLDSFVEVKEQLNDADLKYLRALYRLMYDRWPPKDLEELKKEILQFQGFTFNRKSDELEKRQQVLKRLPDATVLHICKLLDLKEGTKDNMISDIIKFLLKPVKVIYSVVDPFQSSMQPVVKLEKMLLGDNKAISVWDLESKSSIKMSKRKRFPSSRLNEYVSGNEASEGRTSDSSKTLSPTKPEVAKNVKKAGRPPKRKLNSSERAASVDESRKKIKTEDTLEKGHTNSVVENIRVTRQKGKKTEPENKRTELLKLAAKIQNPRSILKVSQKDGSVTLNSFSLDFKEDVDDPDMNVEEKLHDGSSETLSADETRELQPRLDSSKKKKVIQKRSGQPLRCFNYIKDNILSANFSALQRLHILLFGASDKVENLKTNILSFGGFPFLEGSEEWKQKEFLLSLLAQNTLREYLNLLCIDHGDDDNHTLINKLMVFLAAPKSKQSDEIRTQVISSEPVSHAPSSATSQHKSSSRKGDTAPAAKRKGPSRGPNKKVLMDEEQVRRLESDFAREQRTIERAKRQVEKLKLTNELNAERSGARSSIKFCQALKCNNNSKDNKDISFYNFPREPVKLEKWLTNTKLKTNGKTYTSFLCAQHFDVRAFTNTCRNARLHRHAVPTIPAPGSTWNVKYPCLDGYATPGTSRVKHGSSPSKKEEADNSSLTMSIDIDSIPDDEPGKNKSPSKSSDSKKQAPLQKLIGDLTKKRASMMAQQTDSELLDALLQTVYKRRALKNAGAVISTPNKGVHTRLGELDNVKFLVVTANYSDLDVLHHLIYMTEATKTRVRKNILDFAGFNFAEDSTPYKDRMEFLKSLGYNISKRIGFLLGLCPYKLDIDEVDLNELIMYFLMSPCKSKQVPIRHLPQNFFTKDMPKELCLLLQKHGESASTDDSESSPPKPNSPKKKAPIFTVTSEDDSPPKVVHHQKAKKSFKASPPPLIKKTPALPAEQRKPVTIAPRGRPPGKRPFILPNILSKPTPSTIPLATTAAVQPSPLQKMATTAAVQPSPLQKMATTAAVQPSPLQKMATTAAVQPSPLQKMATTAAVQPSPLQKTVLKTPLALPNLIKTAPQEFLIQQKTPDGQQKTYKLIKLPATHPLNSAIRTPALQTQLRPQLQANAPIAGPPLPPGIILFKNNPAAVGNVQTVVNPVPQAQLSAVVPSAAFRNPELTITPVRMDFTPNKEPAVPEKKDESIPLAFDCNEKVEVLHPLEDNDPTDEDLYSSIQEIIHNSNFEDITLRNVIERVSAQYAAFDLTQRHAFMKECVKKIIIGT